MKKCIQNTGRILWRPRSCTRWGLPTKRYKASCVCKGDLSVVLFFFVTQMLLLLLCAWKEEEDNTGDLFWRENYFGKAFVLILFYIFIFLELFKETRMPFIASLFFFLPPQQQQQHHFGIWLLSIIYSTTSKPNKQNNNNNMANQCTPRP